MINEPIILHIGEEKIPTVVYNVSSVRPHWALNGFIVYLQNFENEGCVGEDVVFDRFFILNGGRDIRYGTLNSEKKAGVTSVFFLKKCIIVSLRKHIEEMRVKKVEGTASIFEVASYRKAQLLLSILIEKPVVIEGADIAKLLVCLETDADFQYMTNKVGGTDKLLGGVYKILCDKMDNL
jgi:hypothetical protein